ncbi:AT-rich interactive domain-containing protein 4B isoform X2 [Cimex lectularius]|uniref:ARID domain-containing protein n=1 Tax=Cimex lectularius TaxID=79782 RepID=A0A8I6RGP2_CIMLE|nr:AT-rich interactive domain-containing protein 4B isoform X2 [Cimex lectularius]
MSGWTGKRDMLGDEPPYLAVGTEVSAKYKGAFCEAKIRKVVRSVKCKVLFKQGLGSATVADDQIKGVLRNGATVEVRHSENKEFVEATITKIQDCSQYTVVFDDGDITTLRRSALCMKSGRHFAESETLDQLPLTHPEHFGTPVIGGRRGRRNRTGFEGSSDDEESLTHGPELTIQKEEDIGRVVCVEGSEKRKQKDNWFPGLVVAPTAQDTVEIHVKEEYLVRSFKDGRYYTVPKNEATEFTREIGSKVENQTLKAAVDKALLFLDRAELPPHWDRELLLYGLNDTASDSDHGDCESSDDEPREEKDHFVAQLYKFMDDSGTPINKGPTIGAKDVDLYRLFKVVQNLGGYNRVTNTNNWKTISHKMGFGHNPVTVSLVKQSYKKFLYSFEEFYRKLGCTMINHPRLSRNRSRSGRSLIRDRDRASAPIKTEDKNKPSTSSAVPQLPLIFNIKPDPDAVPVVEPPPPEPPKTYPTLKEKLLQKKTVAPVEVPFPIQKIKEEKKDPEIKIEPKEVKKEVKPRQTKAKPSEPEIGVSKPESMKDASKDRKKKILLRLTGGNKKDSTNKSTRPQVQSKVPTPGLANTRQKRTMKDRVKAFVDQFKTKGIKYGSNLNSAENEKNTKAKIKEEPNANPSGKGAKKEDIAVPIDDKKKGRKRKERGDPVDDHFEVASSVKAVSIGDKLQVCYEPTLSHESKVTYEAKVLNVREEDGEKLYLVHYNGWNSRYDEWIKMSRIAHNYSWTGGRTPKKFLQASMTKTTKKKNQKTDSSSSSTSKEQPFSVTPSKENNRQGSVGRCTTPSSVTSVSSRKYTNTRAFTRSTNKRELSASETDHEYESDYAEIETTKPTEKFEEPSSEKKRKKRKVDDEINPKEIKIKQEPKDEEMSHVKTRRLRKNSLEKAFDKEKESSKTDSKSAEEGNEDLEPTNLSKSKESSCESLTDESPSKGFEEIVPKTEPKDEVEDSENKSINLYPIVCQRIQKEKTTYEEVPNLPKGRDFDLTQIRSELKGIDPTTLVGRPSSSNSESNKEFFVKEEIEAEDVYEFKEPEPFEFEVRKSLEDKNKLNRRNITGRLFDDKSISKSLSTSPAKAKSPVPSPSQSPRKDDSSIENLSTIQTCEEAFDKICASPLRAATEHRSHIHLQIFGVPEDNSDDDFEDDSQDRLVISERDSDNFSNMSNDKESDSYAQENPPVVAAPEKKIELETKENFPKDDEDEDMEDEAINVAIQRAIQESSDDTNDGEFLGKNLTPKVITQTVESSFDTETLPQLQGPKCEPPSPSHLESIGMSTDVESVKTYITHIEEQGEIQEDKKEVIYQDDLMEIREVTTYGDEEIIVEEEGEELEVEVEEEQDMLVVAEEETIEDSQEVVIQERITTQVPSESVVTETVPDTLIQISSKEIDDEDESEENNLDSLICEETIPRSPTPQTEIIGHGEEEAGSSVDVTVETVEIEEQNKESPIINEPAVLAKEPVIDHTPPNTPESSLSSLASPRGHEISPPHLENESIKTLHAPLTTVKPEPLEMPSPPKTAPDTRSKKAEANRSVSKKGRRPRKRSEETGKRKNPRTTRHHGVVGSDSDEVPDQAGSNSRRENRSPRPGKYNFSLSLGSDIGYAQKIAILLQTLGDIRKAYTDVKSELAMIDRRRKKLRRRERESAAAAAAAAASTNPPSMNNATKVH